MKQGQRVQVRSNPGTVRRTYSTEIGGRKERYCEVEFDSGRVSTYPSSDVKKLKERR